MNKTHQSLQDYHLNFDEAFNATENAEKSEKDLQYVMEYIEHSDMRYILNHPEMTPFQIYNKGRTVMERAIEHVRQISKYSKK